MAYLRRNKIIIMLPFFLVGFFSVIPVVFAQGLGGVPPTTTTAPSAPVKLVDCGLTDPNTCNFAKLYELIGNIWKFLLQTILAPVAIIALLFAGFKYVMARGNPSEIQKAHEIFYYVVIGIIVAFAAWIIINAILVGLGVKPEFKFLI